MGLEGGFGVVHFVADLTLYIDDLVGLRIAAGRVFGDWQVWTTHDFLHGMTGLIGGLDCGDGQGCFIVISNHFRHLPQFLWKKKRTFKDILIFEKKKNILKSGKQNTKCIRNSRLHFICQNRMTQVTFKLSLDIS